MAQGQGTCLEGKCCSRTSSEFFVESDPRISDCNGCSGRRRRYRLASAALIFVLVDVGLGLQTP